ncbi:hypothetical protein M0802_002158 [Mischocyttarus mexicanus]|nr:hypothetical protein M0802_002158 [Mischocyttarus mexicanus]
MKTHVISSFIASIFILACTSISALQVQGGNDANQLQRENYEPIATDFLVKYLDDRRMDIPDGHNLDSISGSHLLRSTRRNLDFYPALIYEKQRYFPLRKPATLNTRLGDYEDIYPFVLDRFGKRNFDEIDANAFDNFYKRNFDEIDRVGWSGFVKRLSNYLGKQQQLQQQQQQQQR